MSMLYTARFNFAAVRVNIIVKSLGFLRNAFEIEQKMIDRLDL